MSMLFTYNGTLMSFKYYLLCEAISPRECSFGTDNDTSNKEWIKTSVVYDDGNPVKCLYTFTKIGELYYNICILSNGDISFGVADDYDSSLKYDKEYFINHFLTGRRVTNSVLKVFSNLFYIFLDGMKTRFGKSMNVIFFSAANPALGSAYKSIVTNKFVIKALEDEGFYYDGMKGENFTFKRIKEN